MTTVDVNKTKEAKSILEYMSDFSKLNNCRDKTNTISKT